MSETILYINQLTKEFNVRGEKKKLKAVNGVSLELKKGEVFGIVGESGSGKSTLARCAFGIIEPTSGEIEICGQKFTELSKSESKQLRSNLGFVFQDPQGSINPRLLIREVISEPLINRKDPKKFVEDRVNLLAGRVGLSKKQLDKRSHELSGGQCQRVAIARALATNPKVVLLDEPTSALDLSVQAQILNLLEELRSEFHLTYLMISHNLEVVSHLSDRVAVMKEGKIIEEGLSSKVLNSPSHIYTRELISAHSITLSENLLPPDFDLDSWQDGPTNKWAFQNIEKFLPVAEIHPPTSNNSLKRGTSLKLENVTINIDDQKFRLDSLLSETHTDSIIVLRGGEILYEKYFNGMQRNSRHLLQSVSKSILGALYGRLIDRGVIDAKNTLGHYVPEFANSAFGDATIQEALDMTVSVKFSEDYSDSNSEIAQLDRACGWRNSRKESTSSLESFLPSLLKDAQHGMKFQYCSANTDALAWVIARVTETPYAQLLQEELWNPLGAEYKATIAIDKKGLSVANGGISATAVDLAHFGHLMLEMGRVGNEQVVPSWWIIETFAGGASTTEYPEYLRNLHPLGSYKNQWWSTGSPSQEIYAVGIYGQYIWIDPTTKTVIVKFSSIPIPVDPEHSKMHVALFRKISSID